MRWLPLVALSGCATFNDLTQLTFSVGLPTVSMDSSCTPSQDDQQTVSSRALVDITTRGDTCLARFYARSTAIFWSDVRNEIPLNSTTQWTSLTSSVTSLTVGSTMPEGTELTIEQLISTESGELPNYEAAPLARVDAIGAALQGHDELLFRTETHLDPTSPEDLLLATNLTLNESPNLDLVDLSYGQDEELQVIMLVQLAVPRAALEQSLTPRVEMAQELTYEARIRAAATAPGN